MDSIPGIAFSDSPTGRRAVIAGTGIEVWEVVAAWQGMSRDFGRLLAAYDWLEESDLRNALEYHRVHPEEIEGRIAQETAWTPDRISRLGVFLRDSRG